MPKPPKLPLAHLKLWVYGPFGGEFDEAGIEIASSDWVQRQQ